MTYGVRRRAKRLRSSSRPAQRRPHKRNVTLSRVASALTTYLQEMAQKEPAMNRYALIAQEHWKKYAPSRYAALEDPEDFFEKLGESAEAEIDLVTDALERQIPSDLPYLERVGQLRAARAQAEEVTLSEMVYSVTPEPANLGEELTDLLMRFPAVSQLEDLIAQINSEAETAAEELVEQGQPYQLVYLEQDLESLQMYQALISLLSLTDDEALAMTEAQQRDRILALQQYWNPETDSLKR